jgi:hypothetical protein
VRELSSAEGHGHTVEGRSVVSDKRTGTERGPLPGWALLSTVAVVVLIGYSMTHDMRPGAQELISMVVFGLVATTIMDLFAWWRGE